MQTTQYTTDVDTQRKHRYKRYYKALQQCKPKADKNTPKVWVFWTSDYSQNLTNKTKLVAKLDNNNNQHCSTMALYCNMENDFKSKTETLLISS